MTTFLSKASKFQLVLKQAKRVYDGQEAVGWTDPQIVEFQRGTFIADATTAGKLGYQSPTELVDAMRKSATYNTEFWEVGNEPGAMKPSTPVLLGKIADYAVDHDADKLREIIQTEQETYGEFAREDVIEQARRALGRLGDTEIGKRGPGRPKVQTG
jgi:hypothetical protein